MLEKKSEDGNIRKCKENLLESYDWYDGITSTMKIVYKIGSSKSYNILLLS